MARTPIRLPAVIAGFAVAMASGLPAQTAGATQEGGYEVKRRQISTKPPADSVGWKKTDRETRVGNTPETDGNSRTFVLVVGTFAKKCPTADGKVAGTFESSVTMDEVNTDDGETKRSHHRNRLLARLEGQVGDDGALQYVELEGEVTHEREGTPAERRTLPRQRFTPSRGGAPDWEAMRRAVEATGELSVATAILYSDATYTAAELEWRKQNQCVEFAFDPPSDERMLAPNQSEQVRATLRMKEGQHPVARGKFQGGPLNGIGQLAARQGETKDDGTIPFTYTASANPKEGHGFDVTSLSRAGLASAKWQIRPTGNYELHFESNIVARTTHAAQSRATGTVKLTGSSKPGYYGGKGAISIKTAPTPARDPCVPLVSGSATSQLSVVDMRIAITPRTGANGAPAGGTADIQMQYAFSLTSGETETNPTVAGNVCVLGGESTPSPFWWMSYASGRSPQDIYFLKDWTYVGRDGVIAKKTLRSNCSGGCDEEVSVFTLKQVRTAN